jgi:excisionase family DNA binding protein
MIEKTGDYLTVDAAARESGFSAYYIRKLARAGTIAGEKWGNTWMINKPSLMAHKVQMETLGASKHNPHKKK